MRYRNSNLKFSVKLLDLLSKEENIVISPYGIICVLAMVAEGANKNGVDEILACLDFKTLGRLRANLENNGNYCNKFKIENEITLMRGEDDIKLLESYKNKVSDNYPVHICEVFSDKKDTSMKIKNLSCFKAGWKYKMKRITTGNEMFQNADKKTCKPVFLKCTESLMYFAKSNWNLTDKLFSGSSKR